MDTPASPEPASAPSLEDKARELLAGYHVIIRLPIQWGEQDLYGHVNNIIYFRWFESARVAYGDRAGLSAMIETHKIGPILAAVQCNYRRQLNYPDTVRIGARITKIGRSSMVMEHRVFSEAQQAIAAEGDSTVVCFDYGNNRPIAVPDHLRRAMSEIEGHVL